MTNAALLTKAIELVERKNQPLNTRRVLNVFRQISPSLSKVVLSLLFEREAGIPHHFEKRYPKTTRGLLELKKRKHNFFWKRRLFLFGEPTCLNCGAHDGPMFRKTRVLVSVLENWPKFCCDSCSKGSEEVRAKRRKTCLRVYGVDNAAQSKQVKKRIVNTFRRNYGVDNPMQSAYVRRKARKTCLEKYGVDHPMKDSEIAYKCISRACSRRGVVIRGRLFKGLRGFEEQAIDYLIRKKFKIIAAGSDKQLPHFVYVRDKVRHVYLPDLYVEKHERRYIVEIKSRYTLGLHGRGKWSAANLCNKARAVERKGYTFVLLVLRRRTYAKRHGLILYKHVGVPTLKALRSIPPEN